MRSGITVFLGQAKVNDVDQVAFLPKPHQEIIRLHISVDEVLRMDELNPTDLWGTEKRNSGLVISDEFSQLDKS